MSFSSMYQELLGIDGLNFALAKTRLNEALGSIYDSQLFSFQLATGGWLTPGLLAGNSNHLSPGLITVAPFTTTITGNAAASAAWLGLMGRPFLTEYQIRVPYFSVYSIVSVDATIPTAVVLTIDRPWMEPAQANSGYMMYQCYFPVPVSDFKEFKWARDTSNNWPMNYWKLNQADLAARDAQRTCFDQPAYFVPYQPDTRPGSATFGNMLFELWPHPLSQLPYTFGYMRTGPLLVNPTDTVPYPLTEDLLKFKAYELLYLWKESQKSDQHERGAGADWLKLAAYAAAEYKMRLKQISLKDQQIVDNYWTKVRRYNTDSPYASITGQLNVGSF